MTPYEAADALTEVAASHQDAMEAVYRAILLDLLVKHGDRGLAWSHIQDVANLDGMAKMQGRAGTRSVEALWLDQGLDHGLTFPARPQAPEQPEGEDG
jgi:hypothetical protein